VSTLRRAEPAKASLPWGKETVDSDNVVVFTDVMIAVQFLCQG
jgi:hypothetical protein